MNSIHMVSVNSSNGILEDILVIDRRQNLGKNHINLVFLEKSHQVHGHGNTIHIDHPIYLPILDRRLFGLYWEVIDQAIPSSHKLDREWILESRILRNTENQSIRSNLHPLESVNYLRFYYSDSEDNKDRKTPPLCSWVQIPQDPPKHNQPIQIPSSKVQSNSSRNVQPNTPHSPNHHHFHLNHLSDHRSYPLLPTPHPSETRQSRRTSTKQRKNTIRKHLS